MELLILGVNDRNAGLEPVQKAQNALFLALLIKLSQRSYRAIWYIPGLWNSLSGSSAEGNASYLAIVIELAPQNALRAQRGAPKKKR